MLADAKSINTFFRDLDAEAMPVEWYYGLAYANLNDIEKSKEHYMKAYAANPTKISILNNLGQIYFKEGQYNEAIEWFNKALAILPDYLESNVNLSSTYYKLGDYENALKSLNNIPENKRDERIKKNMISIEKKINHFK
jgi:tetratricopeptide (TPR) repeat protein